MFNYGLPPQILNINTFELKLLFTQDALVNAGAERSHLEILSRFSEEVDVGFVYFYPKHDLKEAYERAGIRLFFLDIPESYHFLLAVRRLLKLIRQEKPDLLVSSLWRADIITRMASWITGVPLVGTLVNDSYAPIAWKDKKGLKYKVVYWLDRLTAGIPKHWIANAQALADSHVKTLGLDATDISVVYRGRRVPVSRWLSGARTEGPKQSVPDSDSVEKDCFVVPPRNDDNYGFIAYGRLLERKGFQDAIQAFALVNEKYPDCLLTIYGEGPYRAELERLIGELGLDKKVILPGKFGMGEDGNGSPDNYREEHGSPESYREENEIATPSLRLARNDATTILLENDCFLFPSWYEGFSGALVEAMMVGIPIIASDIPMNLEAVGPENALIFEVQNISQLTEQMIFAIKNPRLMADLGSIAKKEAITRFNIEKIAAQYEETLFSIYKSVKVEA